MARQYVQTSQIITVHGVKLELSPEMLNAAMYELDISGVINDVPTLFEAGLIATLIQSALEKCPIEDLRRFVEDLR